MKRIFLSLCVGIAAGLAAAIFLISLHAVTQYRLQHPEIIGLLPFAAMFVVYAYDRWAGRASRGVGLILQEIHSPQQRLPLRMAPMVLLGTVLTHLFGGSAGREGTAVQMGASLADQTSRFFHLNSRQRKSLLAAGMGAGFAGAIGVPWAGMFFGLEVLQVGRLKWSAWLECLIAAWISYGVTRLLPVPHTVYFHPTSLSLMEWLGNPWLWLMVGILAISSGLSASLFNFGTHRLGRLWQSWIPQGWLRAGTVAALILVVHAALGTVRYAGLGVEVIQQALAGQVPLMDPVWKGLLTAMTLSAGLKGGEFIPLVFIGTTLGRVLVTLVSPFMIPFGLGVIGFSEVLPVVGFAAVFAAASNTPLACSIMVIELFGWQWAPFVFFGTSLAYHFSGHHGIYPFQKVTTGKWWHAVWHRFDSRGRR